MTTVDPQEVIDRGLRLNPDRAASIAYALLDAERKIRDVQTLVEDAMTTGERWIPTDLLVRAALGGPAAPTPEPTITDHDGFGAPIMDHAQEPQPIDEVKRLGNATAARILRQVLAERDREHGYLIDALTRTALRRHADALDEDATDAEPVERITDGHGDEQERGADTDAEAANQPQDGGA